jgi:hypothetical protein
MDDIKCSICDRPVKPKAPNYRKVVGWEQVRKAGGANAITLRSELGVWAHSSCMEAEKLGLGDQLGLFA